MVARNLGIRAASISKPNEQWYKNAIFYPVHNLSVSVFLGAPRDSGELDLNPLEYLGLNIGGLKKWFWHGKACCSPFCSP